MAYTRGQKLECVADDFAPGVTERFSFLPKKGGIYTFRDYSPGDFVSPDPGIYLEEITGTFNEFWEAEHGFQAHRFRPIVTKKTSIEVFTAMLKPSQVDA